MLKLPSTGRRVWIVPLRLAASLVILTFLFHFIDVTIFWPALRRLSLPLWFAILFGYLGVHVLGCFKWAMMMNLAGIGLSPAQAGQGYFGGLFATLFLPSIVGGDLVRVGLTIRLRGNPPGVVLGNLVDRIVDAAALVCVAGVGASLIPDVVQSQSGRILRVTTIAIAVVSLVSLIGVAISARFAPVRRWSYRTRRELVRLRQAFRSMLRQPQRVLVALSIGITVQTAFVLLTSVIASGCGLHVSLRVWLVAWPLAKLAALLPVTQGGIGVREAALAALATPFGAPPAMTVAVGLVWETIIFGGGLVAGVISYSLGLRGGAPVPARVAHEKSH